MRSISRLKKTRARPSRRNNHGTALVPFTVREAAGLAALSGRTDPPADQGVGRTRCNARSWVRLWRRRGALASAPYSPIVPVRQAGRLNRLCIFIARPMSPAIFSLPLMNAIWPLSFPLIMST